MHRLCAALFVVGLALAASVNTQAPAPVHLTCRGAPARTRGWPLMAPVWRWHGEVANASGGTDVYVAVSADGGRTFGAPVRVSDARGTARVNGETAPRVASCDAPGSRRRSTSCGRRATPNTAILLARSIDGGRTFGAARELQRAGRPATAGGRR